MLQRRVISQDLRDLFERLLEKDPKKRIEIPELKVSRVQVNPFCGSDVSISVTTDCHPVQTPPGTV